MNTDLLKYDASSIRELCRRKLLESGAYTDQIYPGSDISIIIDIFSWTFNVLTYMLNANAADVLFNDSEVYENLNKAVKLLSYSPKGYTTSQAAFNIDLADAAAFSGQTRTCVIPRFASVTSEKTGQDGSEVRYSFTEDYSFNVINGVLALPKQKPTLKNGSFTKHTFGNSAAGAPFEVFTMTGVGPNGQTATLIDNDSTHVYVETVGSSGAQEFREAIVVKSLILDASFNDLACELRFNESKELEVKFGDGVHGKRLEKGNKVHVIYLKSNGPSGMLNSSELAASSLKVRIDGVSSREELLNLAYGGSELFLQSYSALFSNGYMPTFETNSFVLSNPYASTEPLNYEDVAEIKENAPASFRVGNRLVTAGDFRTFILDKFKGSIRDVYVCNNSEYCSLFYRWLDSFGCLNLNIRLRNYEYANACDFNNVYIFVRSARPEGLTDSDRSQIRRACDRLKPLTANVVPCEGIRSCFMPYVKPLKEVDMSGVLANPEAYASRIVIRKGDTYFSDAKIRAAVAEAIVGHFRENCGFGARVNLADLQQKIMALGYIDGIRTVSALDVRDGYYVNYVNGLSFAKFTPDMIEMQDLDCFTQIVELEKFQYGELLAPESVAGLIEITDDNGFTLKNNEF